MKYSDLSTPDLEVLLRSLETAGDFGPTTTAIRVILECRKAGLKEIDQ